MKPETHVAEWHDVTYYLYVDLLRLDGDYWTGSGDWSARALLFWDDSSYVTLVPIRG